MSRNSKNARKHEDRLDRNRKNGYKGPATTAKKTKKVNTWFARKDGKVNTPEPRGGKKREPESTDTSTES